MTNTNSLARDPKSDPSASIDTLQPVAEGVPLTALQLKARLDLIQQVMKSVMVPDVDYGVIPGTKNKPTLLKPGAEKLCVTFRLAAEDPIIEELPSLVGDIRYRLHVRIVNASGGTLGVGVGECSTGEEKYKWRRPVHVNEYNAADVDRRREKFQGDGSVWKQVRVNPADVANTVLKIAHKRAYIHGVIMATAAGSIFSQDVEDLPAGLGDAAADEDIDQRRPPIGSPQRKAGAAGAKISEAQAKRFFAIAMGNRWTKEALAEWLKKTYNVDSDRDLLKSDYEAACRAVATSNPEAAAPADREPGDEGPGFLR